MRCNNCKQMTKFNWNLSALAVFMAGLVRSPQNNPTQQPLLSDALTQSKRRLRFFGHICRADPNQDHSRALYASTTGLPKHWRRRPGRPRQTWLRTVENDLWSLNLGLATAQRRAQNRTAWQTLVETAPDDDDDDPKTKLFVTVQTYDCQSVHLYKYQTQLKSVFKMSYVCSNASSKTCMDATAWSPRRWTPVGNVPALRSGVTSADQRHEFSCDTHAPAASPNWLAGKLHDEFFALYPFSCL